MISYKKMSLFDAPVGSYMMHACNSQGVWGSGIAKEFKDKFPQAFAVYHRACQGNSEFALGKSWSIHDSGYNIVCLITSQFYGKNKSTEDKILELTRQALSSHLSYMASEVKDVKVVYSDRFNSGLFGVPWHKTEKILKELCEKYNIECIVCDPNLGETSI